MKKTAINLLKTVKTKIYNNTYLLIFIALNTLNGFILKLFTIGKIGYNKSIIGDIVLLLVISSFALLFKNRKHRIRYLVIITFILSGLCLINSAYYNYYMGFTSVSFLKSINLLLRVGDSVLGYALTIKDLIFFITPIIFILFIKFVNKNRSKIEKAEFRYVFIIGIILFTMFTISLTRTDISRINTQWNTTYLVDKLGIYYYQTSDILINLYKGIVFNKGDKKSAYKNFTEYYEDNTISSKTNEYTDIFKGKNVIIIHAESMQSFAMELEFEGKQVTPTLNNLKEKSLYFNNFYAQVATGNSSDSEFTFSTGFLPVNTFTVFRDYPNREYITLQKEFKKLGYRTYSMHANDASFWNRNIMYKSLGYDKFYSKKDFEIDEVSGFGLTDKSFFRQSIEKIKQIDANSEDPYLVTEIMLTNHTPFTDLETYGEFPTTLTHTFKDGSKYTNTYMEGSKMSNYLKSLHYADEQLGMFIESLDLEGLLEDTVIVLYGDHDAKLPRGDFSKLYNYSPICSEETKTCENYKKTKEDEGYFDINYFTYEMLREVPFLIYSKDITPKKIDTVSAMYNAFPTIANMFGFKSKYLLSNDLMNVKDNIVIFPNGNFITNELYYSAAKGETFSFNGDPINLDKLNKNIKKTTDILQVSQDTIIYDLIKYDLESDYEK
ncbi:MAG: LTA synthase family protein [Bacilli bacterium]